MSVIVLSLIWDMIVDYSDMVNRLTFPKSIRLVKNSQFKTVMAQGISARDELLVLYACENGFDYSRLGVSIGKSCGTAVVRNRLKRLLREAFRQNTDHIAPGFDYVVRMSHRWIRRAGAKSQRKADIRVLKYEQIRDSFLTLAARLADGRA